MTLVSDLAPASTPQEFIDPGSMSMVSSIHQESTPMRQVQEQAVLVNTVRWLVLAMPRLIILVA
ncbi:MAG: hypothetical protein KME05_02430 [Gloeocapsa sp. UFS-A4-WI-NPMV-4B04]|nr:hypothetical protein [Gloeocapsa sp. UFS-A4-WI-NPMV-4B04]